jgi:hypothetical protein
MVSCLFLKTWPELLLKLSLIHFSPTDPLFCCCQGKPVHVTPLPNTGCHYSAFYLSPLYLITKEIGALTKPARQQCNVPPVVSPTSYMRLLCVPYHARQAIIWKQSRASFWLDALLACLSPYAAKALILISPLAHPHPLYLTYVVDVCRPCDETPALLCSTRLPTCQATDLLSFNKVKS